MKFKNMITVIDSHTEGQPTRMVISGYPKIPGKTMAEKRDFAQENLDHLRTAILHEPRGMINAFGCVMTPPVSDEAAFGIIWMQFGVDKELRYIHMCGHGTIGVATIAVEMGLVETREPVTEIAIDTPAGLVCARVNVVGGKAKSVTIQNIPSFLYQTATVNVPGLGKLQTDIAFGGCNYAIVEAKDLKIKPTIADFRKSQALIAQVLKSINEQVEVQHPEMDFIKGVPSLLISDKPTHPEATVKNIYIDEFLLIDRSPCGTGTCARMAARFGKGELKIGEPFVTESIAGTIYRGKLVKEAKVGNYKGAIPEVTGRAFVTGISHFIIDEDDPFKYGFML